MNYCMQLLIFILFLNPFLSSAKATKNPKTRPPRRTAVAQRTHPSLGGRPYSDHMRQAVQTARLLGRNRDLVINTLRQNRQWPSIRTERRHAQRQNQFGHIRPLISQGNRRARILRCQDLYLLAYHRVLYPKSTAAEVNAFLWNVWGRFQATPQFFHPSQISRAEDQIGLLRKRIYHCTTSSFAHQSTTSLAILEFTISVWNGKYSQAGHD